MFHAFSMSVNMSGVCDYKQYCLSQHIMGVQQYCINIVLQDIMGPLSAASMESGSSHRGYPYLVQLHMLGDIESAAQLCLFKSDQEKHANLDTLINLWSNRYC